MIVGVRSGRGLKDRGSFKGMCTLHDVCTCRSYITYMPYLIIFTDVLPLIWVQYVHAVWGFARTARRDNYLYEVHHCESSNFFLNFELEWMTLLYSCQSPYSSTCYSPWLHKNLFWSPVDQYIQGTGLGVSLWVPPFDVLKISKVHAYTLFYSTLPWIVESAAVHTFVAPVKHWRLKVANTSTDV